MISIRELKSYFDKYGYVITEEALFNTYKIIKKMSDEGITSIGVFGPSGSGKTEYVKVLRKILTEILEYNIQLVSTMCNYDLNNTNVEDNDSVKKSIVNKKYLIEAIDKANSGSKVILFIDGYDEVDSLTDKILANFIQDGIIIDDNVKYEVKDKNNLIFIIAGNSDINLFESLERRLNKVKLSYLSTLQIIEYIDMKLPNCNYAIKCFIMSLYKRLEHPGVFSKHELTKLPSLPEIVSLIDDVEFLIEDKAKMETIKKIIIDTMIKSKQSPDKLFGHDSIIGDYMRLFDSESWNEDVFTKKIIELLKDRTEFDKSLLKGFKEIEKYNEVVVEEEDKNNESLVSAIKDLVMTITNPYGAGIPDKSDWYNRNKFHSMRDGNKWIKIAEIKGAAITNYLRNNESGVLSGCSLYKGERVNYNSCSSLYLCHDKIISGEIADLSIYASDPVISYQALKKICTLLKNISYTSCKLDLAFLTNLCINNESTRIHDDKNYPGVLFTNIDFIKKDDVMERIESIYDLCRELTVLDYSDPKDYSFIVPTRFLSQNQLIPIQNKFYGYVKGYCLKLGKVKLNVESYVWLTRGTSKYKLCSIVNDFISDIYNSYVEKNYGKVDNGYRSDKLFIINRQSHFSKKRLLQKGIFVVNEGTEAEYLLINPYEACIDEQIYDKKLVGVNEEVLNELVKVR